MFLNSAIKTILYIIGAIIIGRVKETLFALVIWCIIRKQSGGRHAKKDFVCFVISGSAIFFPVMVSSALKLTLKMIVISVIVINLIYMLYAPYDEYFYGLKTFLDFETELSNFLVHISQINNVFYAYCTKRDSKNVTQNEIEEYKKQLEKSLLELYEDENAKISFKIGFVYLYSMNFALRTEDDDYEKLKYQDLNVSKFKYQNENWEQYRRRNETQNCSIQKYIVERMRNSLMHGHIEILLNKKGEIEFVFRDKYNKRNEVISIILEDLEEFLSQQCLYSGIPKKTLIFRVQQR